MNDIDVFDAVNATQKATLSSAVVTASGAGKAYQSVSQTAAIAVQDAADNLRNVSTISTTALGVAMAQFIATGEPKYKDAIKEAQGLVSVAAKDFATIGAAASSVLKEFPSS